MTDFVISQWDKDITREEFAQSMINYAQFLKQPLKIEMFVPCNEGNVLEEPKNDFRGYNDYSKRLNVFEKAKEKVLFEGFEVIKDTRTTITVFNSKTKQEIGFAKGVGSGETIESLILFTDFTGDLTPTALKQIL